MVFQLTHSILITTKNRLEDLKITLNKISYLLEKENVECIICDDGSSDGTFQYLIDNYKQIQVIQNKRSKGLIFSRNRLLNITQADYAITLDDDAHIVSNNPSEIIESFFLKHPKCAVIASRIFWGKDLPSNLADAMSSTRVKGFVGCGHVWRMDAWRSIPNYPDWFVFYGEEEFASYQLFKNKWEVWYVPALFIQHRVDVKSRKKNKDYTTRLRRSLRSGWYLYFMFYPLHLIPKKFLYTLWIQLKLKVLKGDFKALKAILWALFDLIVNLPKCFVGNRLSSNQIAQYRELEDTKIYWSKT